MAETRIPWCHYTFNPWWGCARVSPGCVNCYADTWAKRTGHGDLWRRHGERRFFGDAYWRRPLKWDREAEATGERRRVFCASMADVFELHPERDIRERMTDARHRLWELIGDTPNLDWLLLTKRPENVQGLTGSWDEYGWPPNVWIGTSVEDQRRADERIPHLLEIPAAVRFLSCEPLLQRVDLSWPAHQGGRYYDGIDWVIVGGESGPSARPMNEEWVSLLLMQCRYLGMAPFVKQLGSVWAKEHHARDTKGEDPSEWPADLRVREFPTVKAFA